MRRAISGRMRARASARVPRRSTPAACGCPPPPRAEHTESIAIRPVERSDTFTLPGSTSENRATTSTPAMLRGMSTSPSVSELVSPWRWNCSGDASITTRRPFSSSSIALRTSPKNRSRPADAWEWTCACIFCGSIPCASRSAAMRCAWLSVLE